MSFANIFSLKAACPLFTRDKKRADCGAAEPGPHAVWGPRDKEPERKERGGKRLSSIINLHSPLAVAHAGTTGCALLHYGNVEKGGHLFTNATYWEPVTMLA